ncbi:MAG TPA: STAS domain-containing protein [Steroidobacteraceae bacterium]|nr:STAS domain-containing protein [Steroidobacteraceae bacterium]
MARSTGSKIAPTVREQESDILQDWLRSQLAAVRSRSGAISDEALRDDSRRFLSRFSQALGRDGADDGLAAAWDETRAMLGELSRSRAVQGFSPAETASFVFSLKRPLFEQLSRAHGTDARALSDDIWRVTELLDGFGLYTIETFQKSREEIIARQQQEMLELSTPVTQIWDGILAVPLIGTLDSARTQVVMENLLTAIVQNEAVIAIIDITGVPTVDTLVAQHLLRTVSAARLMGAECIISGIRPQIAQTIVHLGVDLGDIETKATLADALRLGLARRGLVVTQRHAAGPAPVTTAAAAS